MNQNGRPYESASEALRAVLCGPDGQPVTKDVGSRMAIHWTLGRVSEMERQLRKQQEASPTADDVVEDVAAVCHDVNRAYCQALGDLSQPTWATAPDWQRESAKAGVRFYMNEPAAGPHAGHESWLTQKLAEGWKYGPEKDPDRKLHPCIVPFEELPREQRAKDYIFRAVVLAMTGV